VPVDGGAPPPEGRPIAGDWDGDGIDGIGLFLVDSGIVFLKNVADNGVGDIEIATAHKGPNVWPIAGDWDGCGPVRVGLYDDTTGTVYLLRANATGAQEDVIPFSTYKGTGRVPIAGRWLKP